MKIFLSTILVLTLAFPLAAFSQGAPKIGTVDMQRAFKEYYKTKDAEAKINDARSAAKKEYDDRAEAYKKALDEINSLNKQLDAPALTAEAKTQKAKERDDKIANIKKMEREINDFSQTRVYFFVQVKSGRAPRRETIWKRLQTSEMSIRNVGARLPRCRSNYWTVI